MLSLDKNFLFIHIPKTGGKSIKDALALQCKSIVRTYGYDLDKFDKVLKDNPGEYFRFCFVRNPWDRMVSSWKWACRKRQVGFTDFVKLYYYKNNFNYFGVDAKFVWWHTIPQSSFIEKVYVRENK